MHDRDKHVRDLREALSQEKSRIALLIGAGCPVSVRVEVDGGDKPLIPDVAGLTKAIREALAEDGGLTQVFSNLSEDGVEDPTIEDALSHIRRLEQVVGSGTARGLSREQLQALEGDVCAQIYKETFKQLPDEETPYHQVARWIGQVDRDHPVTVFTTNYDLLMEQALEECEVAFFDGFSGAFRPFYDHRGVEGGEAPARWVRLWKLHGSVNWRFASSVAGGKGSVLRVLGGDGDEGALLIHPSELKYDQSRRMPYLAMFDRLRAFLREPGAVLVTCGYSFADQHINETILEGLAANPSAAAFGLLYKSLGDEPGAAGLVDGIARNLSLLAKDCAVIRGKRAEWHAAQDEDEGGADKTLFELGGFDRLGLFLADIVSRASKGLM